MPGTIGFGYIGLGTRDFSPRMKNHIDKNIEKEMETGVT